LQKLLRTQKVGLLALPHVSNVLGTVLPVNEIVKMARQAGELTFNDGAQAAPHFGINLSEINADFYAFSGHKLYGPTGIGILYVNPALHSCLAPAWVGGGMVHQVGQSFADTTWAPMPYRFEAGTPPIVQAVGVHAAIDFIENITWPAIVAHHNELAAHTLLELQKIPGLTLYGRSSPAAPRLGVFSFNLGDIHPHDVGSILATRGVAVRVGHHCAQPLMKVLGIQSCVRASLGLYNNSQDVDALIEALHFTQSPLDRHFRLLGSDES
jgi:cysteine desulfurase/selenocysteine lyase